MSPSASAVVLVAGVSVLFGQQAAPPPSAPVLIYERQPLRVPIACRAEDFDTAGIACSDEEPCRIFLELTSVEAVGAKVLLVGNIHTSTATLSSLALLSEDAGTAWREPVNRVLGAGFESIQFLNDQQAWIGVQPQAQFVSDPYLLATSDGGAKWEPLRIWSEEGRSGLLQQFYFENKDHGFALIDRSDAGPGVSRYELYETPNSGATWMLKETSSRPIAPKWPQRRASEWRLREDAKSKTYEVERRVGDSWRRMANFRTDLGVCKNLEPKPAPPPPKEPNP